LFSRPDVLLLDEPTNNLDIHSIRWLERVLKRLRRHDDHQSATTGTSSTRSATHIADLDFQQLKIYPGNYDDFMLHRYRRGRESKPRSQAKTDFRTCKEFVRRFSANLQGAAGHVAPSVRSRRSRSRKSGRRRRQIRYIRFEQSKKLYRSAVVWRS